MRHQTPRRAFARRRSVGGASATVALALMVLLVAAGTASATSGRGWGRKLRGDECDDSGRIPAVHAAAHGCKMLKIRCNLQDGAPTGLQSASSRAFDGVDTRCMRTAQTRCRTSARQNAHNDLECQRLLEFGPPDGTAFIGCRSIGEISEEFSWAVREFCAGSPPPMPLQPAPSGPSGSSGGSTSGSVTISTPGSTFSFAFGSDDDSG